MMNKTEEFQDNKRIVSEYDDTGYKVSEQIFYKDSERVDCTVFPKGIEFVVSEGSFNTPTWKGIFNIDDYELIGNQEIPGLGVVPVYKRKEK